MQEEYKNEYEETKAKNRYNVTDTPAYQLSQNVERLTNDVILHS